MEVFQCKGAAKPSNKTCDKTAKDPFLPRSECFRHIFFISDFQLLIYTGVQIKICNLLSFYLYLILKHRLRSKTSLTRVLGPTMTALRTWRYKVQIRVIDVRSQLFQVVPNINGGNFTSVLTSEQNKFPVMA